MSVNYNDTPWVLYKLDHKTSTFDKNYTRSCSNHSQESTFRADALNAAGNITGDYAMSNYKSTVLYKASQPDNATKI